MATTNYNYVYKGRMIVYNTAQVMTSRGVPYPGTGYPYFGWYGAPSYWTYGYPFYGYYGGWFTSYYRWYRYTYTPYYYGVNNTDIWNTGESDEFFYDFSQERLNYVLSAQYVGASAYGLKPNTEHKMFLNGRDITKSCKQEGRLLGAGLTTDDSGRIEMLIYFGPDLDPGTLVEKQWSLFGLYASSNLPLKLVSSDDQSTTTSSIRLPYYVNKTATEAVDADYNVVQTFYADPELVNNSPEISVTNIHLFFKERPSSTKNKSGMVDPSVTVSICEVENDEPVLTKIVTDSVTRLFASEVFVSSNASEATFFRYRKPVKLATGKTYGIVVSTDDPGFELWYNKQGDRLIGTNTKSPGSNLKRDGKLFKRNNSNVFTAVNDTDIKFTIDIAKYTANTITEVYVNKFYEFFTIADRKGQFYGGEWVYKNTANAVGNVAVTQGSNVVIGTGTSFNTLSAGQFVVIYANSSISQPYAIGSISNATHMTLTTNVAFTNVSTKFMSTVTGRVYFQDEMANQMFLTDSSATSSIKFAAGDVLVGTDSRATANIVSIDQFSLDRASLKGDIKTPAAGTIKTIITAAYDDGSGYTFTEAQAEDIEVNATKVKNISTYDAYILSRSTEVDESLYTNTSLGIFNKSLKIQADLKVQTSTGNLYYSPTIDTNKMDLYSIRNYVSNVYTTVDNNGVVIDTEVAGNGLAIARHISTKVNFATNKFAEDVRVYMSAYRPANTELRVYARLHNSADPEAFDDKHWTPLEYVGDNANRRSASNNEDDYVDFELGLPSYIETANNIKATFTSSLGSYTLNASKAIKKTFNANTGVANTTDFITLSGHEFANGDQVFYSVDTGNTAIGGLTENESYYIVQANSSGVKLSTTVGGAAVNVTSGVTESGHSLSYVLPNDVIKLYSKLFPENYIHAVVNSVSTSSIDLKSTVANNGVVGSGMLVDRVKYPLTAFNNITNDNVARYYNSSLVEFDQFDSMQIKIVMLADTTNRAPKVNQIQVIGVSA